MDMDVLFVNSKFRKRPPSLELLIKNWSTILDASFPFILLSYHLPTFISASSPPQGEGTSLLTHLSFEIGCEV
jgi:hypothetical protein